MTCIDGNEISDQLLEVLVEELDGADILMRVRHDEKLGHGFKPVKKNLPHFRKRIRQQLAKTGEMDVDQRDFLAHAGFNRRLPMVLSTRALQEFFMDFLVLYGRDRWVAALLVDTREPVRRLALDGLPHMPETNLFSMEQRRAAAERITQGLTFFLSHVKHDLLDILEQAPRPDAKDVPEREACREQVSELKETIRRMREDLPRVRSLQKKVQSQKERIQTLEKEKDRAEKTIEQVRCDYSDLQKAHEEIQRTYERQQEAMGQTILERVEQEKRALIHSWLRPVLRVERAVSELGDDAALITAAEQVLHRQEEADRHSGNRRTLMDQRARLQQLRRRIQKTRVHALNPVAELERVEHGLAARIQELDNILGDAAVSGNAFLRELEAAAASAEDEQALMTLQELVQQLLDMQLLEAPDARHVFTVINNRMARLYDASWPAAKRPAVPRDTVLRFMSYLSEHRPMFLLLDGHNILYGLPDLYGDLPHDEARSRLVSEVQRLVAPAPECVTRLYFDSPDMDEQTVAGNMKTVYSGGGLRDQKADSAIIEYLEYCCREYSAMPRFVVTDDHALRFRAGQHGADAMSVVRFGALLERC